jgi:hypothetical protein
MAGLVVTGFDANGRITPKGSNIVIPPQSAGIGDLVYKNGSTIKVIGRGTATGTTISLGGTSFTQYGGICSFVNGQALLSAPNAAEASKTYGSYPSGAPTYGAGTVLMRNGLKTDYYAQMNTAQQMSNDAYRGTAGTNVHPTAAYSGGVMTESSFNNNTNNVKNIYGSWWEYLRQTLRVNGAPGTPFGAVANGVKVHEFGRWMTRTYLATSSYPAGYHCYTYRGAGDGEDGKWWLPSMFELAEIMIDEHLDRINENGGIFSIDRGAARWSCVCISSSYAWFCNGYGMSSNYGFGYSWTVRPVTLLKLV